jgi:signal transduction histidine kinase
LAGIDLSIVNSYVALLAATVNFTLALLIILRTSRETVFRVFALVCLGVAWWNFWDFMVWASGNPIWMPMGFNSDTSWKNIIPLGSTLAAVALFHFTLALVGRLKGNRYWVALAYCLAALLAIIPIVALYSVPVNRFWTGPGWHISFFVLLFPFIMASIVLLNGAFRSTRGSEEAQWLGFVLAAVVLQVLTGMTDFFHKIFPFFPPLGHLGSVVGPVILTVGVFRHRSVFDVLAQAHEKLGLISNIATEVSHEVRNPLTAIKGAAGLLTDLDREIEREKIRQYGEIITEEIERIEVILGSLTDLTKPVKMEKEWVKINEVLEKTVQLITPVDMGMNIDLFPDKDLPLIEADPSLLKQVFLNVIRNAVEACEKKGNLWIRTALDQDFVYIEFTDNGPGVAEEIRLRVFEPFFTTKESGLGLGLMVVKRILLAHGGRVDIQNVEPRGAKVALVVPR